MNFLPLANNPRYARLMQDKIVQERLHKAHEDYLALLHLLPVSFKREEEAHRRRALTPTIDESSLSEDVREFERFNPAYKGALPPTQHNIGQDVGQDRGQNIEEARHHTLAVWKQILESKL